MSASPYPKVTKFFLCIDLRIGVLCYISFEMMLWLFLSYAAIDNEFEFFRNYDLYKFEEHIEDNWYYELIFGLPEEEDYDYEYGLESVVDDSDGIDIEYRFQSLTVNGILMLIFIAYSILSFVYTIGIGTKNTNLFIPYFLFDIYIIWISFIMIIGGLFELNFVLIRNCSIFASVKIYPAICNYSLFRKLGGKFEFTREVPSPIGPNIDFESRRRSSDIKKKRRKDGEDFEMETLQTVQIHRKNSKSPRRNSFRKEVDLMNSFTLV
ncbi:CLUMA_CG020522, isoform A [Clunio marinus]|uniref:CLUMA_CG020522, isoform A n=1 Tax=Clunio marinus TaxID=568069 RepID=A0A1J1J571_9DIPT|nr:CLUMA_CG020522, isoform A [Clunio marinus]